MYLFQHNRSGYNAGDALFTFHYVSISTDNAQHNYQGLQKFTFHYVSISTIKTCQNCVCRLKFTFHYVSISTIYARSLVAQQILIYIPLCIYFNRQPELVLLLLILIYIPLCIYFNRKHGGTAKAHRIFTFHYVSISTHMAKNLLLLLHNLHSTMYLFQPLHQHISSKALYTFTFHYVSISTLSNPLNIIRCPVFTFHYVSISTKIIAL